MAKPRDPDAEFFTFHPDRQARIRSPIGPECHQEFHRLGDLLASRRRILVWRVPPENPFYDPVKRPLLKIPFLKFSDETIEDNDETLLPILHELMEDAKRKMLS
jgi:hypothetical protein